MLGRLLVVALTSLFLVVACGGETASTAPPSSPVPAPETPAAETPAAEAPASAEPVPSAPASPAPAGKRPPCQLGQDQACNENPAVSSLWGRCTEYGTCECKPGFELNPWGRCQPAK